MKIINRIVKAVFGEPSLKKPDEMVHIPIFSSSGFFTSIDDLLVKPVAFAHIEGFIFKEYGVLEANAIGITADDSIDPSITGYGILVDMSDTNIEDGEAYAALLHNKVIFRNVSVFTNTKNSPNEFLLKPGNQKYESLVVPMEDVTIIIF